MQRARLTSLNLTALLYVHPLAFTRWDPFVGFGIGFAEDAARKTLDATDFDGRDFDFKIRDRTRRGMFRFAAGLDVFVSKRVAVGPRFSIDRQFIGGVCNETSISEESCVKISVLRDDPEAGIPDDRNPVQDGPGRMFVTFAAAARVHL